MKTVTKSVKGTELAVGDVRSLGWEESSQVVTVQPGQLEAGARYQDVTTENGKVERCWEGFFYSVLVQIPCTILNSTPAEIAAEATV